MSEPPVTLEKGEKMLREVASDRARYWRDTISMGLVLAVLVGVALWLMGNQYALIGVAGALAAAAARGFYLASEQLSFRWRLTDRRLILPSGGSVMLLEMETIRRLFGDVQIITRGGDKHLVKHVADAPELVAAITGARDKRRKAAR